MKRIGLLSDTHGYLDTKLKQYLPPCDEIWHAGDIGTLSVTDKLAQWKTVRAVYGNIDNDKARMEFPLDNRFTCEDVDVWITHIGGYPNKYNVRIREEIKQNPPKIFISGHSHILKIMPDKKLNLLHINPGACGNHGLHKVKTVVRFAVEEGRIKEMEVVELGLR